MRFFSAKGEYAVLAVVALSLHTGNDPLQVKIISQKKGIPLRFLEQVMSLLKKKGLVESVRGPHGGYRLTRSPDQISFGEVLQAVEGTLTSEEPLVTRNGSEKADNIVINEIWSELNATLNAQLHSISFEDICQRKKEKEEKEVLMFHI